MTGWLLVLSLLVLGGILSALGDRLGTRLGKARLSVFNLRPRRTAVLITVLTGSLISTLSLSLLLLVSRQLRVGLFALDGLQAQIKAADQELNKLEKNIIALRQGDVVLSSGQLLAGATIEVRGANQAKRFIDKLLQEANLEAFRRVRPGEKPNRQILLVPRTDIQRLEEIISKKGNWVVNIRSAANVLLGENLIYAFPDVRTNSNIATKGEVLATTILQRNERSFEAVSRMINLLLASTLSEVKRRGSLTSGLQFDANSIDRLVKNLIESKKGSIQLESVSLRSSETADPVAIQLQIGRDSLR